MNHSIDLNKCRGRSDFSRGFYTTTSRTQAVKFANGRYSDAKRRNPDTKDVAALLSWEVDRDDLGGQVNLVFVRANEDFWDFVSTCRGRVTQHRNIGFYDIVYGPVNSRFEQRLVFPDSDQLSFHTVNALNVLQQLGPTCLNGAPYLA
jgi:hypothetical protein